MLYPWLLPWFSLASALQGGFEVAQGLLLNTTRGFGWQQFRFTSDFPDVPVVVVLPSLEDLADPATVRIRNVTMKGFQASIAEPRGSDGVHADMTFSYMAASQGIWSLNGTIFEARLLDITERQAGACRPFSYPNMAWKNVAFQYSFSTEPVILTSIQTANNEQRALPTEGPSEPWLVSGVRSLTKSTVQLALDSSTAPSGSNNDLAESIGFIALEPGLGEVLVPPRSTVELFLDNRWCIDSTWLYIFSTSPEGCFLEMQDRSNCSNTYVNYGTGGHCGCVANDTDCATSNGESTAKVYRAAGTTTSQVVRFAGQEARLAVTTSNPPPPETVSLDSSLSASVVVAGPAGRAGEDGWWPRGDPNPAGTTARFVMEEAALFVAATDLLITLASDTFSVSTGQVFNFSAVDVSQVVEAQSVFKDETQLTVEVLCSNASDCLDGLRIGGDANNSWTVEQISNAFTVTSGAWQNVSVSVKNLVSYTGSIPWTGLTTLESLSGSFDLRNLQLKISRGACWKVRHHGSVEPVSIFSVEAPLHVEVQAGTSSATSTTSTSSSTSSTTTTSTSSSSTPTTSTSSSSSTTTSTSSSSTTTTSTSSSSTTTTSTSSSRTASSSTSSTASSSSITTSTGTSSSSTATSSSSSTSTATGSTTISISSTTSTSSSTTSTTSTSTSSTSSRSSSSTSSISSSSRSSTITSSTTSTSTSKSGTTTFTSSTSLSSTSRSATSTFSSYTATSSTSVSATTTSATRTTTSVLTPQAAVLLELEESTTALVSELLEAENRSLVVSESFGTMAAMRLPESVPENTSFVAILEGSPAAAVLPPEVLALSDGAALVMTAFDGNSSLGSGVSSNGGSLSSVLDAVDISLVKPGGSAAEKISVTEPIYVRISTVAPDPTWLCAYLDGDTWSQDGVRMATAAELQDLFGEETSGVWCATTHLSIFSAVVDLLLDCTNLNVLSPENLQEVVLRPWWFRPPALLLGLLLVGLLSLIIIGLRQDAKIRRLDLWRGEYFLTEVPPISRCSCQAASASFSSMISKCRKEKKFAPEMAITAQNSMEALASLSDWVKKQNLEPSLPLKMQELVLCQNTLREVAFGRKLHPSFMMAHIWGPEGWVQGSLAVQKSPKLKGLHVEMQDELPKAFVSIHQSRWRRLCSTAVSAHPVGELWLWDLHMTSAKRAKIIMDCVLGSLAFVALFFSVDGSAVAARNSANCPVEQGSVLWYVFVAFASICLNLIPRSLLAIFAYRGFVQRWGHWRLQLRLRQCMDLGFWTLAVLITCLQLLVIIAFLANLREADEGKWMISFGVVVIRKMIVVPVLACIISSLGTEIHALTQPQFISKPPKQFGLDIHASDEHSEPGARSAVWMEKVEELAGRGLSIRQLLGFYSELGGSLMPHFDPDRSTTHDVVRQAIIPSSLQLRTSQSFLVVVHGADDLDVRDIFSSDPYCVVSVSGKPWKGGGRTATMKGNCNPAWEEAFLLHDVVEDDAIHFGLWDEDALTQDDSLGEIALVSAAFWRGYRGHLLLQGCKKDSKLSVSIRPNGSLEAFARSKLEDADDMLEKLVVIPSPRHWPLKASKGAFDIQVECVEGHAYASCVNISQPCLAQKMVTHSWANNFSYLLGAILADSLQAERYDSVVELLKKRNFQELCAKLSRARALDVPYWVCAFSVNQHCGICATPPDLDSTGFRISPCLCSTPKHFQGDLSEMNKFDDMMAFLKVHHRRTGQVRLEQVVALEPDFRLLQRAWCIAELVEANELHLRQTLMVHSAASRERCLQRLFKLDVRDAEASFPADKDLILGKIENVDVFNHQLQDLLLHRLDTFLEGNHSKVAANFLDEIVLATLTVAF